MSERRSDVRIKWNERITARDLGSNKPLTQEARLRDISKSGLAFIADEQLRRGQTCDVFLSVALNTLKLRAELVHVKINGPHFIYGAKIVGGSWFDRLILQRFLRTRIPSMAISHRRTALIAAFVVALILNLMFGFGVPLALAGGASCAILYMMFSPL